jgi:hypothetical protein
MALGDPINVFSGAVPTPNYGSASVFGNPFQQQQQRTQTQPQVTQQQIDAWVQAALAKYMNQPQQPGTPTNITPDVNPPQSGTANAGVGPNAGTLTPQSLDQYVLNNYIQNYGGYGNLPPVY